MIINLKNKKMKHIIYIYKDNTYQSYKKWSFEHCEKVLERLGATYWEIGSVVIKPHPSNKLILNR